jgi:hypothetical protein
VNQVGDERLNSAVKQLVVGWLWVGLWVLVRAASFMSGKNGFNSASYSGKKLLATEGIDTLET